MLAPVPRFSAAGHPQQQRQHLAARATSTLSVYHFHKWNSSSYSSNGCQQRQQPWRQQDQQQQQQLHHQERTNVVAAAKGFGSLGKTTSKAATRGVQKCPCGSGKQYQSCCGRYHNGDVLAPTPEALLRARYSAYSLQLVDYLVATTHKENPEHTGDPITYARSVQRTARGTEYLGLTLLDLPAQQQQQQQQQQTDNLSSSSSSDSSEQGQQVGVHDAYLKFSVKWRQRSGGPQELSTEVSHFKQVNGAWLYYAMVE